MLMRQFLGLPGRSQDGTSMENQLRGHIPVPTPTLTAMMLKSWA